MIYCAPYVYTLRQNKCVAPLTQIVLTNVQFLVVERHANSVQVTECAVLYYIHHA